jgi:tripartite-type tricarboxylate transporter receptor subunit TctC
VKRRSLQLAVCALAAASAGSALAQPYPTRLVRIVVGFAPGGSMDVVARITADKLRDSLGQQVIVENRPGAGGSIAADALAKAAPDGHTIMLAGGGTLAIRQKLELKLPYDPQRDFAPVVQVANLPLLLVVTTSLPVKSVKELVSLARARPGQLNFPSSGVGSTTHLSSEMFKALAKIDLTHVPYKGSSQMLPDLIAGQLALAFDQITTTQPYITAGKLRPLAISTPMRSRLMPTLPTVAEAGVPGYESISWNGFVVPAATPRTTVERLNHETVKLLNTATMAEKLASIGAEPAGGTVEQFAAFIKAESLRWARLIDQLGIKPQ